MAFTAAQLEVGARYALAVYADAGYLPLDVGPAAQKSDETREQRIARETKELLRLNMIGTGLLLALVISVASVIAQFAGWLP